MAAIQSNTHQARPKRRWFQFSLRSLLLAVLVISLPLAWIGHKLNQLLRRNEAVSLIRQSGGTDDYDGYGKHFLTEETASLSWLERLVGSQVLAQPKDVDLDGTSVTDAELAKLASLESVEMLSLAATPISDAGLAHLARLRGLRCLALCNTKITDNGLMHLTDFAQLQRLNLEGTLITDAGLVHLKRLTKLEILWLANTNVTQDAIADLQEALPDTHIVLVPLGVTQSRQPSGNRGTSNSTR